jgi:hypothetical protein
MRLPEPWEVYGDQVDLVAFIHGPSPRGWIDVIVVAAVIDPPCPGADPQFIGKRPEDVIDWLISRPWLEHDAPRPYNVGRYLGRGVDIRVTRSGAEECGADLGELSFFRLGRAGNEGGFGQVWTAEVGERKRVIAIEVNGRTVTLVAGSPFADVEQFWIEAESVLQSIAFAAE